jgi:hypothetical protein
MHSRIYKYITGITDELRRIGSIPSIVAIILIATSLSCCTKKDEPDPLPGLKITGVSIPSSINVVTNGDITLTGKGFAVGDQITLTLISDPDEIFQCSIISVSDNSATFTLPPGIYTGQYRITVSRGTESLVLGSTTINIIVDTNIPDIEGMTVKGLVYADGVGLPGVTVSDGYEVTVTDEDGIYYLPSLKKTGFVFISIPGNYEVSSSDNNIPLFFKRLAGGTSVEQKDFSLIQVDNSKHVVLTMADWHLANRNDDIAQFNNGFLLDVNSVISNYESAGTKVYGLTLGDLTWDAYWYTNNFRIPDFLTHMNNINCKIFNMMGNHDNDPYIPGDFLAENPYREFIGPTYYSFNLGNAHYIVLDNIEYLNTGGSQGVIGARNYNEVIISAQFQWLIKDLATISDKNAPLFIGMHSNLFTNPSLDAGGNQTSSFEMVNGSQFVAALQDFTNVHVLTGHTHINYNVPSGTSLIEHNTAAVSATWWWTGKSGYAGNHTCKDGSPGGYGIWEIDGNDVKWRYKGSGKPISYQFRSYDLNECHITAAAYAPNSTDAALAPYAGVYANSNSGNEVLINVWGYDPEWTVEVSEGGNPLEVTRVTAKDPLHIISYEAMRLNAGAIPTSSFVTGNTSHMFKVVASSPNSTLEITVTDRFGNVYSESMTRPKQLTCLMN